VNKYSVL